MIASYRKAPPSVQYSSNGAERRKHIEKIIAKSLLGIGIFLITSVGWPIISYELFTAPTLGNQEFLAPVPVLGVETKGQKNPQTLTTNTSVEERKDLTKPQNWFPGVEFTQTKESKITHYTVTIPKFKIEDAVVEIGGEDLSESLIHYPGTALPGELGATVIFGHSILPQFFNPDNYMAIFSLIPTLEFGDEIIVKFDGITYTYRVMDKVEVKPTNLSVLNQPYDNEYLRLITCTPPGTYLRRGVITATLVN